MWQSNSCCHWHISGIPQRCPHCTLQTLHSIVACCICSCISITAAQKPSFLCLHWNLDLYQIRWLSGFDCQIWSPAMKHFVAEVLCSWCHVMLLLLDRPTFALKNVNIWYKQRFVVAAGALYHVMLLLVDRADLEALKLTRDGDGMPLKRRVISPL